MTPSQHHISNSEVVETIGSMFPDNYFDACLCDPPYLLEFMGLGFDRQHKKEQGANDGQRMQRWHERWTREVLRVLKPGAHMLAFGGTRTYHRLASAAEDVGFEVRDMLTWLHGQGFPKNKDTQLKPAVEPCVLARKKGGGRLNIDGCRVGTALRINPPAANSPGRTSSIFGDGYFGVDRDAVPRLCSGRWPANLILSHHPDCIETDRTVTPPRNGSISPSSAAASTSRTGPNTYSPDDRPRGEWKAYEDVVTLWECHPDCPVRMLDEQTVAKIHSAGTARDGSNNPRPSKKGSTIDFLQGSERNTGDMHRFGDSGGASRFFYCAKVSTRERNLGGIDCRHATLKPISLTTYLSRLLLPPPHTDSSPRRLIVPFSGAGSEIIGALLAGWDEVWGIEQDQQYCSDAEARIPAALATYSHLRTDNPSPPPGAPSL